MMLCAPHYDNHDDENKPLERKTSRKRKVHFGPITKHLIEKDQLPKVEEYETLWYKEADILTYLGQEIQLATQKKTDTEEFSLRGLELANENPAMRVAIEKRNEVYRRLIARDDTTLLNIIGNDTTELQKLHQFAHDYKEQVNKAALAKAKEDEIQAFKIYKDDCLVLEAFPNHSHKNNNNNQLITILKSFFKQEKSAKAA